LATQFWGKSTTSQALKYLRQSLWHLQTALGCTNGSKANNVLLVDSEWIGLNPQANLWLDIAEFEQAFGHVQGVRGQQLDLATAQKLQNTVQLYQSDLLDGWYEDWCLYERERFRNMYLAMLDKLLSYCEAHQQYEAGMMYGTQVLKYDQARERICRRLMRLHYLAGNRTSALRQYERCVTALKEELGVAPAQSTVALYEQIRADQLDGSTPILPQTSTPLETAMTLPPKLVKNLKQLHKLLTEVQHKVENDIQAVESVLNNQR
jgi:DNA-binding SARP family transcriptional activator